jgi:hypothetical protein
MDPNDEEVREVYARFGLAYYHSEVLHRGLCNLYAHSRAQSDAPSSWPRVEEHLTEAHNFTFGRIVKTVTPLIPATLLDDFRKAIEQRNFLAHHFWYDHIHLLTTSQGCMKACSELMSYGTTFQALNSDIERLLEPLLSEMGATETQLHSALEQVRAGTDKPFLPRRHVQKEEVLIAVYEIQKSPGMSALIFQTKDSVLWQLCDAGLGWSAYEEVGSEWVRCPAFRDLVPAHINPRPPCDGPWHYDIFLGKGASLIVRPGEGKAAFRWSLRRKGV